MAGTRTNSPQAPWRQVAAGVAVWLIWAAAVQPEWTGVLLLLSPLVLFPLGLRLAASETVGPDAPVVRSLSRATTPLALTAAISFVPEPGWLAAVLSLPWLAFTSLIALAGVGRVLSRRTLLDTGVGADAGLIYVVVGGAWLTISRAGLNPLGFSDAIVQLTAVHFHYAGFALPIVASLTARHLGRSCLIPLAVIVGVPLTAAGITTGGWLEWIAATTMAIAGLATAGLLFRCGSHSRGVARPLIVAAGASLATGMTLAIGWAWAVQFDWKFLGLETMAATHGSLNALGFGLLGLVGLNLLPRPETGEATEMNMHLGRPAIEQLEELAIGAADAATTNPVGLLDRPTPVGFRRQVWQRTVEHGDFDVAVEAIRRWSGHDAAGIARWPATPALAVDTTLAMSIPVGPIAVSATCRIVKVIDEPDRFGFIYATLPHHPEDGEESFIVARHPGGDVDVTVTAVWRPATLANHVAPPLTRFLQNRAIHRYLEGIVTNTSHIGAAA